MGGPSDHSKEPFTRTRRSHSKLSLGRSEEAHQGSLIIWGHG